MFVRIFSPKSVSRSDNKYYFELDRFTYNLSGAQDETVQRFDNQSSLIWRVGHIL